MNTISQLFPRLSSNVNNYLGSNLSFFILLLVVTALPVVECRILLPILKVTNLTPVAANL